MGVPSGLRMLISITDRSGSSNEWKEKGEVWCHDTCRRIRLSEWTRPDAAANRCFLTFLHGESQVHTKLERIYNQVVAVINEWSLLFDLLSPHWRLF